MKIDKRQPRHWFYLTASGFWALLAVLMRRLRGSREGVRPLVLLYGHKLGGNLLALYRYMRSDPSGPDVAFLTMDPAYHRELAGSGERAILATSPRCLPALGHARAMVTDHGLHALLPLLHASDMRFFDVWHGIPFKGFDAEDFRTQHRYDEAWVASHLLARLYVDKFGFPPGKVVATGYARTDRLVREKDTDPAPIRRRLGLPEAGKVVLFAPTWQQDDVGRSVFPFGLDADEFLGALSRLAIRAGATVVLRTHLNSGRDMGFAARERIVVIPYADHPDTEEILLATDVLVCDWSSIAFDFLLLDRPAIFQDVPPPFRKGFSLDAGYRFGAIAPDMDAMAGWIETALNNPQSYWDRHASSHAEVRHAVYGECADGGAGERCMQRLVSHLSGDLR